MKILGQTINALLQQSDIEGLIGAGAPEDEYESEAEIISLALAELDDEEVTRESVAAIISQVWMRSFGISVEDMFSRQTAINSLAETIISNNKNSA